MAKWVKLNDRKPVIPETRDYITVTVKLENNQTAIVHYTKKWGWRDANFTKLNNVMEWDENGIK